MYLSKKTEDIVYEGDVMFPFLHQEESDMSDFREYLNKQLEDPEFKKEWDDLEPEFNAIQAMIDARKKQSICTKNL